MSEVDALFGRGEASPKPRTALVAAMVLGGLGLAVLGLACSVIPGLGLAAWGWNVAEVDWARVKSGYYASDQRTRAILGRVGSVLGLLSGFALLFVQLWLVWLGAYHELWGLIVAGLIDAMPGAPVSAP